MARTTTGTALAGEVFEHFHHPRQRLVAANLCQRVDRAFADPPVLILRGFDELRDRTLVLGLVEYFDGGAADFLVRIARQLQDRVDNLGAADPAQRIARARAHPPVGVLDRGDQELDRLGVANLVQDFHRGATRILVFVAEDWHQMPDGLRIARFDQHLDRAILHFDFRVQQQGANALYFDRTVHLGERPECRGAHQLVAVGELPLQCGTHVAPVEATQDIKDQQARHRVLALQPPEQFGHARVVGDLAR